MKTSPKPKKAAAPRRTAAKTRTPKSRAAPRRADYGAPIDGFFAKQAPGMRVILETRTAAQGARAKATKR